MASPSSYFGPRSWAMLGVGVALVIQVAQAQSLGGWSGLLAVGELSTLTSTIEAELGHVVVVSGGGHDGQVTYVVALDPWAEWAHEVIPNPSYRYRRILLPALASAFGVFNGWPLLWTLTLMGTMAFGLATYTATQLAVLRSLHRLAPLAVVLSVGFWLSLQVTSPDVLAFSLTLAGVFAFLSNRHAWAIAFFALAGLTKEIYILVPLSIVAFLWWLRTERRLGLAYLSSVVPLGLWSVYLVMKLPAPFETGGNLAWPFAGITEAVQNWSANSIRDIFFLCLAIAGLAAALVLAVRKPKTFWTWITLPWVFLAVVSSHWVWDFGNNALRAFAPCATLAVLGLMDTARSPRAADAQADSAGSGKTSNLSRSQRLIADSANKLP